MFKDKNVLITGGKGMVGRALTKLVEKESPNHIKHRHQKNSKNNRIHNS